MTLKRSAKYIAIGVLGLAVTTIVLMATGMSSQHAFFSAVAIELICVSVNAVRRAIIAIIREE